MNGKECQVDVHAASWDIDGLNNVGGRVIDVIAIMKRDD